VIETDKTVKASNVASNVVDTGWDVAVSKNSKLNISQKAVINSQIYTCLVVDFLKDQPPEIVLIASDLLDIEQSVPNKEIKDFYDPLFVLNKVGITGENPKFDFDKQMSSYMIEGREVFLTFEQIYDIFCKTG
jgi:hypothetical protein